MMGSCILDAIGTPLSCVENQVPGSAMSFDSYGAVHVDGARLYVAGKNAAGNPAIMVCLASGATISGCVEAGALTGVSNDSFYALSLMSGKVYASTRAGRDFVVCDYAGAVVNNCVVAMHSAGQVAEFAAIAA